MALDIKFKFYILIKMIILNVVVLKYATSNIQDGGGRKFTEKDNPYLTKGLRYLNKSNM